MPVESLLKVVLLVVLVLALIGVLPTWGYHNRGYAPSSGIGVLVAVLLVLLLLGRW